MYSNVFKRMDKVCYIIIIYEPRYLKRDQFIREYNWKNCLRYVSIDSKKIKFWIGSLVAHLLNLL